MPPATKACIKEGMEAAYWRNQEFKDNQYDPPRAITEYLFTVSVAMELLKLRLIKASKGLLVHVEYNATDFVNNAFPRLKFNPIQRRQQHRAIRKGRIDIAILQLAPLIGLESLVGIELKGFNPPMAKVDDDLRRLAHAMKQVDPIGENNIVTSFSAFVKDLKRRDEEFNTDQMEPRMRALSQELTGRFSALLRRYEGIRAVVDVWALNVKGTDEVAREIPEEIHERADIIRETRADAGVVITLERLRAGDPGQGHLP